METKNETTKRSTAECKPKVNNDRRAKNEEAHAATAAEEASPFTTSELVEKTRRVSKAK